MNRLQKGILGTYLPLTGLVLLLDQFYPAAQHVNYVRYFIILSLFVIASSISKRYAEQRVLAIATGFVVIADFFLVFLSINPNHFSKTAPYGTIAFFIAYCLLALVFQKGLSLRLTEALAAVPVMIVVCPMLVILAPYIGWPLDTLLLVFSCVLSYMSWTAICTISGDYYSLKSSLLMGVAGFLMLVSDMVVGLATFHPAFAHEFVPWLKNFIWATYMPAWAIIVVLIAEDDLLASQDEKQR